MEASSKIYVAPSEKSSEGGQAVGAQLIAEELKKQVCCSNTKMMVLSSILHDHIGIFLGC